MAWPEITSNANHMPHFDCIRVLFLLPYMNQFDFMDVGLFFVLQSIFCCSIPPLFRCFSLFHIPLLSLLRRIFHLFSVRPQYSTKKHKKQKKRLVKFSCYADVVVIPRQRWFMWLQKYLLPIITKHGLDSFSFELKLFDELFDFCKMSMPFFTVQRLYSFS